MGINKMISHSKEYQDCCCFYIGVLFNAVTFINLSLLASTIEFLVLNLFLSSLPIQFFYRLALNLSKWFLDSH